MNLVAKEYVTCQRGGHGALLLSEFAGAAAEMGEACLVNPYGEEQTAAELRRALASARDLQGTRVPEPLAELRIEALDDPLSAGEELFRRAVRRDELSEALGALQEVLRVGQLVSQHLRVPLDVGQALEAFLDGAPEVELILRQTLEDETGPRVVPGRAGDLRRHLAPLLEVPVSGGRGHGRAGSSGGDGDTEDSGNTDPDRHWRLLSSGAAWPGVLPLRRQQESVSDVGKFSGTSQDSVALHERWPMSLCFLDFWLYCRCLFAYVYRTGALSWVNAELLVPMVSADPRGRFVGGVLSGAG